MLSLGFFSPINFETHSLNTFSKTLQQRRSLIEGSTSIPLAVGLNMEHITITADIDKVNISEEVSRTALWKSIVHNESSSNLNSNNEENRSSTKR